MEILSRSCVLAAGVEREAVAPRGHRHGTLRRAERRRSFGIAPDLKPSPASSATSGWQSWTAPSVLSGGRAGHLSRCDAVGPAMLGAATVAKYSAAGAVGCVVSHCGAVPLDVVKTRVQCQPEKFAGQGLVANARTLVAEEGAGVLLGGMGSTALGFGLHGAIKYGGFEALKYALVHAGGGVAAGSRVAIFAEDHRVAALMLAAMIAEFVASLLLCPLEQTRIKMVSDPTYAENVVGAVGRLFTENGGARDVLQSMPAIWTKTVPYTMFQLPIYDATSRALTDAAAAMALASGVALPPVLVKLPASLAAAFTATVVSQPGDTLLSTINKGDARKMLEAGEAPCLSEACPVGDFDVAVAVGDSQDYPLAVEGGGSAAWDVISLGDAEKKKGLAELAAEIGPAGLMVGWKERLAHVASVVVIQLSCYDSIKHALHVPQ